MTAPSLQPGQNRPLPPEPQFTIMVAHDAGPDVDLTAFALTAAGRVTGDAGMIFYNQPTAAATPGVCWEPVATAGGTSTHRLVVAPASWPAGIVRIRAGLTLGTGTFAGVRNLRAWVAGANGAPVAVLDLGTPSVENALIVGEIYQHDGALKVRCVGAGFTDGLAGLATDAGIDIAAEPAPQPAPRPAPDNRARQISLVKPAAGAAPLDHRRYQVAVSLVKHNLDGRVFRVVLAIDCSGSTKHLFRSGVMQRSLERMVPIADLLDDNGELEVWFFGDYAVRSAPVSVRTMDGYLTRQAADKKRAEGGNYEPRVMTEILDWTRAEPAPYPTLVLFWSDGGVHAERKITELLQKSSALPVYWMFLGLGRADYGVLARLDNISGGLVDNAGFIPIDDIDQLPDETLYGEIFGSFVSRWYAAARAAGIV